MISVPITSNPLGANVTLISNGEVSILGATPLIASLDPSQPYDLVVSTRNHPTRMQHVAPGTRELRIELSSASSGPTNPKRSAAPVAKFGSTALAPAETKKSVAAPSAKIAAATAPAPSKSPPAPTPAPATHTAARSTVAVGGSNSGVLMVSAKPPCEIFIDGKSAHMMTPQRTLTLSAGPHTITLVNATQHVKSTTKIEILAGLPSRLVKDFTAAP